MSKCDVRITVDKINYKMGDTVRGMVHVDVDKECKCDSLKLEKYWTTHGKGNKDSGNKVALDLFKGVWPQGAYTYPFKFNLQDGPLSYRGNYINIDWYLNVRADISWAFDPRDKKEFIVEKGPDDICSVLEAGRKKTTNTEKKGLNISQLISMIFPLIFVAVGLYMLFMEMEILIGGIFMLAGSFIAYKAKKSALAERKLGSVKCKLDTDVLKPGDSVKCSVSFTPRSNIKINSIKVLLIGKEVAVSGSGTNQWCFH